MPAIHINVSRPHEEVGKEMGADRLPAADHPHEVDELEVLVAAETSLTCWMMAAAALAAAFRAEVERPGWARLSAEARSIYLPRIAEGIRRAIPTASPAQADDAAAMMLDSFGADEPPPGSTHG